VIEIKKRFPSSKNLDLLAQALEGKPADLFAEGIPQKRGTLTNETGGTLQYIPQLYAINPVIVSKVYKIVYIFQ
jgi:hypothetical protein